MNQIILDEEAWCERVLANATLGSRPSETLYRLARYFYSAGYEKSQIREQLERFLKTCDSSTNLQKWHDLIARTVKDADKYPLVKIDGVQITESEMEAVENVGGKQLRRLAFTLLAVAKYWDKTKKDNDHWVNTEDREIMKMANINTAVRRQCKMFAALRKVGFLEFAKRIDNINVRVLVVGCDTTLLTLYDYRNLGYQYAKYKGEPYFTCANCGLTMKLPNGAPHGGRPQKYCPTCANEIHLRQMVNAVNKLRGRL